MQEKDLPQIETSDLMIFSSIAFVEEAERNGYDSRTEPLENWVDRMGMDLSREVANKAIERFVQSGGE